MKNWVRANKGFLMFLVLFGIFRTAVADWNPIPSGSMRPNLLEGDVVLVNRLAFDLKVPLTDIVADPPGRPAARRRRHLLVAEGRHAPDQAHHRAARRRGRNARRAPGHQRPAGRLLDAPTEAPETLPGGATTTALHMTETMAGEQRPHPGAAAGRRAA